MPKPNPNFDDLMLLMERALVDRGWYVIVVADEEQLEEFRVLASAASPSSSKVGGRTILLPNGSRVSTAVVDDPVHVPKGTSFSLVFMGKWQSEKQYSLWSKQMDRWRKKASTNLTSLLS